MENREHPLKIFFSYDSDDIQLFRIPELVQIIEGFSQKIKHIYYWHRDTELGMEFDKYMLEKISNSDLVVFFCSENALKSTPVYCELSIACALDKRRIPVYIDTQNIHTKLDGKNGIQYNQFEFKEFIKKMLESLTGEDISKFDNWKSLEEIQPWNCDEESIKTFEELFSNLQPSLDSNLFDGIGGRFDPDFIFYGDKEHSSEDKLLMVKWEILAYLYDCDNFQTTTYERILPELFSRVKVKLPKIDHELYNRALSELENSVLSNFRPYSSIFYYEITFRHTFKDVFYIRFGGYLQKLAQVRMQHAKKDDTKRIILNIFLKNGEKSKYSSYSIDDTQLNEIQLECKQRTGNSLTSEDVRDILVETDMITAYWHRTRSDNIHIYYKPSQFTLLYWKINENLE